MAHAEVSACQSMETIMAEVIKLCAFVKIHRKEKEKKNLTIPNADKDDEQLEYSDIKKKAETSYTKKHTGIMAF